MHISTDMNVLILTPDAVGSTLLQRLITVYMQFHVWDQPVINLHELTNGLMRYYSPDFGRELLGKRFQGQQAWGYHQSLQEVVELLESVDHYKTSRLAQYHIRLRDDPIEQQIPFYQYLNSNFFVISCRRRNLFEHAVSWSITKVTKKVNVFDHYEKIDSFVDMYLNPITVDPAAFEDTLNDYKNYIDWCNRFTISSYFVYEDHVPNIEQYILNLPIFRGQPRLNTWKSTYGIEFADWNRCHYYGSDVGTLMLDSPEAVPQLMRPGVRNKEIQSIDHHALVRHLPEAQRSFFHDNLLGYRNAQRSIEKMRELGILVSTVPIKKQTLREKRHMIKNFDQCVEIYNAWVELNPGAWQPVDQAGIVAQITAETQYWAPPAKPNAGSIAGPTTDQS